MKSIRMERLKASEPIVLAGVETLGQFEGDTLKRLALCDGVHTYEIEGDYGLKVFRPAPPKMEKRFRLSGTVGGIEIKPTDFEDQGEAILARDTLVLKSTESDLKVEPVQVKVED